MKLNDLCGKVKSACPQIKNQVDFINLLFDAAGQELFISASYKKQLFSGRKPFIENQKTSLRGNNNHSTLMNFFYKNISDDRIGKLLIELGVPEKETPNKKALANALSIQMQLIIDAKDTEEAQDVVVIEYQKYCSEPESTLNAYTRALYPGDSAYIDFKRRYEISSYDVIEHQWKLQNTGTIAWRGRKLVFVRDKKTRPDANPNVIDIPETNPGGFITLTTKIEGRGFDGVYDCVWEMRDAEDNNCFPERSGMFCITVDVKYKRI